MVSAASNVPSFPARMVEFFAALTNELRALGVTTIMSWELRQLSGKNAVSPLPEISGMLDNLIDIQHLRSPEGLKRVLSLLKFRDFAYIDKELELLIRSGGVAVTEIYNG